jgi:hypothetical protein
MPWFELLDRYLDRQRALRIATEIAERSHDEVWQRTFARAVEMRFPEAQGYVRARAAAVIDKYVSHASRQSNPIDRDLQLELVERATQAVVDSVTHELLKSPQRFAARRLAA